MRNMREIKCQAVTRTSSILKYRRKLEILLYLHVSCGLKLNTHQHTLQYPCVLLLIMQYYTEIYEQYYSAILNAKLSPVHTKLQVLNNVLYSVLAMLYSGLN